MKSIITITDAEIKKIASEYSMTKKNLEWKRINNFVSGMIYMRDFLNLKWSNPKKANTSADMVYDGNDINASVEASLSIRAID